MVLMITSGWYVLLADYLKAVIGLHTLDYGVCCPWVNIVRAEKKYLEYAVVALAVFHKVIYRGDSLLIRAWRGIHDSM